MLRVNPLCRSYFIFKQTDNISSYVKIRALSLDDHIGKRDAHSYSPFKEIDVRIIEHIKSNYLQHT